MSLINYVEPADAGSLFSGIGGFLLLAVMAYILYSAYTKVISMFNVSFEKSKRYDLLESIMLDRIASKKNINLAKELLKYNVIDPMKKKKFRQKIEDEVFKELFDVEPEKDSTD